MLLSEKARQLILDSEGFDETPNWPGVVPKKGEPWNQSGVTIGFGYDLGQTDKLTFKLDWRAQLQQAHLARLVSVIGVKGQAAHDVVSQFRDIKITRDAALQVFDNSTVPRFVATARAALPGFNALPFDAQGALVSLIYNRGGRMKDRNPELEERREMRAIAEAGREFAAGARPLADTLLAIARELRSMQRLWKGKGMEGLVRRREAEAELVESCIQ